VSTAGKRLGFVYFHGMGLRVQVSGFSSFKEERELGLGSKGGFSLLHACVQSL
jgi:hypothetical protein